MPMRSKFPPVALPDGDTWSFLFERQDRPFPDDRDILIDAESQRSYTFAQLRQTAQVFGEGLKSSWSWRKGDVLAIYAANDIDYPSVVWGCHWAGGVITTANPALTVEELARQLKDAGACALVTQRPLLRSAFAAAEAAGIPRDRVMMLGPGPDSGSDIKHFTSVRRAPADTSPLERTCAEPDDLAVLVYSSGTTGLPKGVMLTHRNVCVNSLQVDAAGCDELSWNGGTDGTGDRVLGFLPFYHIYGLSVTLYGAAYIGFAVVVMPRFEMERFCQAVQTHRITFVHVVPPVVLGLAKHPVVSHYDFSSLRMLNSGAAPLTSDLVAAVHARIGVPVKQGYGLSETSPTTHQQPYAEWRSKVGSIGHLMPNMEAQIVDESDQEVPVGATGELLLKGPNVFQGYLHQPERTRAAFAPGGWFRTGDVGRIDADGAFFVTDRAKELVKYKGFQVAPAELEGLLAGCEKVADAAVLGEYRAEMATEVPVAFVVPALGVGCGEAEAREIANWVAARVAPYKQLRGGVRFVDEVPKSASGKILRRVLKQRLEDENEKGHGRPRPKL